METIDESIQVARLCQEVMHLFKHNMDRLLDDTGMSAPQGMLLGVLGRNKKMKITELSSQLCLSNSTVSGIIDRLEKQGMVYRERSEEDKRVVYVSISPDFKSHHEVFREKLEKNIETMMSQGDAEEIHKIFEGLVALKKLLSDRQKIRQ